MYIYTVSIYVQNIKTCLIEKETEKHKIWCSIYHINSNVKTFCQHVISLQWEKKKEEKTLAEAIKAHQVSTFDYISGRSNADEPASGSNLRLRKSWNVGLRPPREKRQRLLKWVFEMWLQSLHSEDAFSFVLKRDNNNTDQHQIFV